MNWLVAPFQSSFTQRAGLMSVLVGILAPVVGTWTVLRRVSYLGDAMSHATVGGVAIGFVLGGSSGVLAGALGAGVVMAALLAAVSSNPRLDQSAVIGVVASAMFAVGIVVIGRVDAGVELGHFLFGQLLTVSDTDLLLGLVLTSVALATVALMFGDLRMSTFDELHARQAGVHTALVRVVLLVLLAVTVVVCLRTVGTLTSMAMLAVPASTARLLTDDVRTMTVVAVAVGSAASVGGLVIAYHTDVAPGASVALTACTCFAVAFAATAPRRHRHPARAAAGPGGPIRTGVK